MPDVLLRAGAAQVVAVDVGYGQLAWALRSDDRVTVLDRVNVRHLEPAQVAPPPTLVTADLSFISLGLVLPALVRCAAPDADFVLLVKPQFEVGKGHVGAGGVVRDPGLRAAAVSAVATAAAGHRSAGPHGRRRGARRAAAAAPPAAAAGGAGAGGGGRGIRAPGRATGAGRGAAGAPR